MSRVQLALNVSDLSASVDFYRKLFGVPPHKLRPGYANFAIADPPLKLVLIEIDEAHRGTGTTSALNHLGVEVADTDTVRRATSRLQEVDLEAEVEEATVCCYARQDKVWVRDPAGTPWEFYTVTDDNPDSGCAADAPAAASVLPLLAEDRPGCCV